MPSLAPNPTVELKGSVEMMTGTGYQSTATKLGANGATMAAIAQPLPNTQITGITGTVTLANLPATAGDPSVTNDDPFGVALVSLFTYAPNSKGDCIFTNEVGVLTGSSSPSAVIDSYAAASTPAVFWTGVIKSPNAGTTTIAVNSSTFPYGIPNVAGCIAAEVTAGAYSSLGTQQISIDLTLSYATLTSPNALPNVVALGTDYGDEFDFVTDGRGDGHAHTEDLSLSFVKVTTMTQDAQVGAIYGTVSAGSFDTFHVNAFGPPPTGIWQANWEMYLINGDATASNFCADLTAQSYSTVAGYCLLPANNCTLPYIPLDYTSVLQSLQTKYPAVQVTTLNTTSIQGTGRTSLQQGVFQAYPQTNTYAVTTGDCIVLVSGRADLFTPGPTGPGETDHEAQIRVQLGPPLAP